MLPWVKTHHIRTLAPLRSSRCLRGHCTLALSHPTSPPQTETSSSRRCSTKVMRSSSPWGSSTSNSTPTPTSPPLQLPRSAARTQGLSQLPMRCLGQTHKYPMMFLPRRFRWKRIQ
ncbi:hypothetical protein VPH35_080499 [Triticum aestivum]